MTMPMLLLVGICLIMASLAAVSIAVATVRAMARVEKAADQFTMLTRELQQSLVQANELTREAREIVASARGAVAPIRRVVERFEDLGDRTARLSDTFLEEVESPLRTVLAVARGVKSLAATFLERLPHRFTHGRSGTNGGSKHE
jgi:biopolymer transport protein ExbB/TolQ